MGSTPCAYTQSLPVGVVDVVKQALDHRADVASAERAPIEVREVIVFERRDGRRSVFSVAIEIRVRREALPEDLERGTDRVAVGRLLDCVAKGLGGRSDSAGDVLDAVEEVVCVLVLEAVVEGEVLEADETDDVGMADPLADDAAPAEQFGLDFDVLVEVPDDRDVWDVHGGHSALVRQRGRASDGATGIVTQELDDHEGTRVGAAFPTPGRAAAILVRGAAQVQIPEVSLEGPVGLNFDEERQVDHEVDVAGAGVWPDAGRWVRHEVARCEAADEVDAVFPRAESAEQGDEDALAGLRGVVVVVVVVGGHGGQ